MNASKIKTLDATISHNMKHGHSVCHNQNISLKIIPNTVYHYIDENRLTVKNIDLKRKVYYIKESTNKRYNP